MPPPNEETQVFGTVEVLEFIGPNIDELRKPNPRIPIPESKETTDASKPSIILGTLHLDFGDMQGSWERFWWSLHYEGAVTGIEQIDYAALSEFSKKSMYRPTAELKKDKAAFQSALEKMEPNKRHNTFVHGIGDFFSDRGGDAFQLLMTIDHLCGKKDEEEGINVDEEEKATFDMEILYSNHDAYLLKWYLQVLKSVEEAKKTGKDLNDPNNIDYSFTSTLLPGQDCSLLNLSICMQKGVVTLEELQKWMKTYLSKLKLFSYSDTIDAYGNPTLVFRSHARAGMKTLSGLADWLKIEYEPQDIGSNDEKTCALIDAIQTKFQSEILDTTDATKLISGLEQLTKLTDEGRVYQNNLEKSALTSDDDETCPGAKALGAITWARKFNKADTQPNAIGTKKVVWVHGHVGQDEQLHVTKCKPFARFNEECDFTALQKAYPKDVNPKLPAPLSKDTECTLDEAQAIRDNIPNTNINSHLRKKIITTGYYDPERAHVYNLDTDFAKRQINMQYQDSEGKVLIQFRSMRNNHFSNSPIHPVFKSHFTIQRSPQEVPDMIIWHHQWYSRNKTPPSLYTMKGTISKQDNEKMFLYLCILQEGLEKLRNLKSNCSRTKDLDDALFSEYKEGILKTVTEKYDFEALPKHEQDYIMLILADPGYYFTTFIHACNSCAYTETYNNQSVCECKEGYSLFCEPDKGEIYRSTRSYDSRMYCHLLAEKLREGAALMEDKVKTYEDNPLVTKKATQAAQDAVEKIKAHANKFETLAKAKKSPTMTEIHQAKQTCHDDIKELQKSRLGKHSNFILRGLADALICITIPIGIGLVILSDNNWKFFSQKQTDAEKRLEKTNKVLSDVQQTILPPSPSD